MGTNKLSGQKVRQIQEAILSGYTTRDALRGIVRIQLDAHLDEISTAGDLATLILELIRWSEDGRVLDLINGANAQNPGNPALRQLAGDAQEWNMTPTVVATGPAPVRNESRRVRPWLPSIVEGMVLLDAARRHGGLALPVHTGAPATRDHQAVMAVSRQHAAQ